MIPHRANVLFLEDNLVSSNFVVTTLRRELPNVTFTPAISLREARHLTADRGYDLYILDIQLPDGNGIDFFCEMQHKDPSSRAIFMTASRLPEYRQRAEAIGAIRFFEKPVKVKEFGQLIDQLLATPPSQPDAFFEGTLTCLTPIDLVQLKCLSQAQVGLKFSRPDGVAGTVYFSGGNVVHAENGKEIGEKAFTSIISWKRGRVEEVPPFGSRTPTITMPWASLLMMAAQQIDERG